jgi:hypothetical protein
MPKLAPTPQKHTARTFFAALFGVAAVWLVLTSILLVWVNRTLTDTKTFSNTISPLLKSPEAQSFITDKVSEVLLHSAPPEQVAAALLPAAQLQGQAPEQLTAAIQPVISQNVEQVLKSPAFTKQWEAAIATTHKDFIAQLGSDEGSLALNLNPLLDEAVTGLKSTQLAPLTTQITVPANVGTINLKGSTLDSINRSYKFFKASLVIVIILAIICFAASIALSVHHLTTLRWILLLTGIITFVLALLLQLTSAIKFGDNAFMKELGSSITKNLVHNLQLTYLVIGSACMVAALGILIFQKMQNKK